MKVKYVHCDRVTMFNLEKMTGVKDKWGITFDVSSFRIDSFAGTKSVYIKYYGKNGLPYMTALKRVNFCEDGNMLINVCGKSYIIGTWEIKEQ